MTESKTTRTQRPAPRDSQLESLPASLEGLQALTMKRLTEIARLVDLKGFSKLRKAELTERLHERLEQLASSGPKEPSSIQEPEVSGSATRHAAPPLDAQPADADGRDETGKRADTPPATHVDESATDEQRDLPSSYGTARVTALAVDPNRLYTYWEVPEDSHVDATRRLGSSGELVLRVFDTTGRLFDGANAHNSFDQPVDDQSGHWFFDIGKPSSEAFVEVGLRSAQGRYVRIARSLRVDFPRTSAPTEQSPRWASAKTLEAPAGEGQTTSHQRVTFETTTETPPGAAEEASTEGESDPPPTPSAEGQRPASGARSGASDGFLAPRSAKDRGTRDS